jgi:enamine deaminase RidA (YjgF/YER057c/UK114 family)
VPAIRPPYLERRVGGHERQSVWPSSIASVSEKRFLSPGTLSTPVGYSHVVDAPATRVVYVAGQVALDSEGKLVGPGDFEAQTRQVFENLTAALRSADVSWSDVVKLNYFVLDVGRVDVVRAIRDEYVDTAHPPASTLVEVSRLVRAEFLIEIDAVAITA